MSCWLAKHYFCFILLLIYHCALAVTMLEIQCEHVHFPEKSNVKIVKLGTKVDISLYLSAL